MKKLQFKAWPKLCSMLLLGAGAMFVASCASDDLSGESFVGTYGGSQLVKPDAASISVTNSSDRQSQTITWKTVNGALSYIVNVAVGDTEGNYDQVLVNNQEVRGTSITVSRASRKYYRFTISTAYNPAEGNTASDPNDPAVKTWDTFTTDIALAAGTNLSTFFSEPGQDPATISDGLPLIINLEAGAQYTVSDAIDFKGVNVSIIGASGESKPIITFGANAEGTASNLVTDSPLTIENVDIRFNLPEGNTGCPLIALSTEPTYAAAPKDYYLISNITLNDVKITDLKNCIFYDNNTKYCVVNFSILNSVINLTTEVVQNEAIISFQSGGCKDFTIKNSTIYGNNAIAKYFLRYNNSARLDRYGFDRDTDFQSLTYINNTFYGLLKADGQWSNYAAIGGQYYSKFDVERNIWYNCGKQIIRRMVVRLYDFETEGKPNPNTFLHNTYFNDDADESAGEIEYDKSNTILTSNPGFANPAAGDFTVSGSEQITNLTGDPRWLSSN